MSASRLSKVRLLLGVLASDPPEFLDRARAVMAVNADRFRGAPPAYPAVPWDDILRRLSRALDVDAAALDREVDAQDLERAVTAGIGAIGGAPELALRHNADMRLARLCYIACRARRPEAVVETGVAYGVTTTFVLKALDLNGRGHLHSIDLPPLGPGADGAIGRLVPQDLRSRWTLHRGASARVLPKLLDRLGKVDVFIHDSLHTFANMRAEFAAAHRHRSDPFVLIADDIELNGAFERYVVEAGPALAMHATWAASAKESRAGICVARLSAPSRGVQ